MGQLGIFFYCGDQAQHDSNELIRGVASRRRVQTGNVQDFLFLNSFSFGFYECCRQ